MLRNLGIGTSEQGNYSGIIKFLGTLLSDKIPPAEKKRILQEEFGIEMSEEMYKEAEIMCNLSQGIRQAGRAEGRVEGRIEGKIEQAMETALNMSQKGLSTAFIADCVGASEAQVEKWIGATV